MEMKLAKNTLYCKMLHTSTIQWQKKILKRKYRFDLIDFSCNTQCPAPCTAGLQETRPQQATWSCHKFWCPGPQILLYIFITAFLDLSWTEKLAGTLRLLSLRGFEFNWTFISSRAHWGALIYHKKGYLSLNASLLTIWSSPLHEMGQCLLRVEQEACKQPHMSERKK